MDKKLVAHMLKHNIPVYAVFSNAYQAYYGNPTDVRDYVRDWANSGKVPYFVRKYLEQDHGV